MYSGRVTLVFVWLLLVAAAGVGLNTGVQAETAAEAEIEFNGTHLITADGASNVTEVNRSAKPDQPEQLEQLGERAERYTDWLPQLMTEQQARAMTDRIIVGAFAISVPVMDAFATFGFRYGSPAFVEVMRVVFSVAAIAPLAVLLWPYIRRSQR